jgi:hypothetical protein
VASCANIPPADDSLANGRGEVVRTEVKEFEPLQVGSTDRIDLTISSERREGSPNAKATFSEIFA